MRTLTLSSMKHWEQNFPLQSILAPVSSNRAGIAGNAKAIWQWLDQAARL
jgi:hypothetical protein